MALLLSASVWALEPPRKLVLPEPTSILAEGAVSLGVLRARPEDAGFQALMKTAWEALQARPASGGWLGLLTGLLSRGTQENVLLGLLPFQGVRMDWLDSSGKDHAAMMLTVAGWPGLQSIFWGGLLSGPDGKPYPEKQIGGKTVILRVKPGQTEEQAAASAREGGSFYHFSDLETARRVWGEGAKPEPALGPILAELDNQQDTYGVILNRNGSLMRILKWVNWGDTTAVENAVGPERMRQVVSGVRYLTWTGDLVDDNTMNMQVKFHTDSEETAEAVAQLLRDARKTLKERGRAADLQMITRSEDVLLDVQMVGYRRLLQEYLKRS